MDMKQLAGVIMKHEGRLGKVEQQAHTLEAFCSKHANEHFKVRIILITNTIILLGIVVGVIIGIT